MPDTSSLAVKNQYEAWPYPYVPLLMQARREDLWQLNLHWMQQQAQVAPGLEQPRIWITGCGTFQPYVIALANPQAQILATDLSEHSLRLAKRRCRFYGIKNVTFKQLDLTDLSSYPKETFDWIESYGVLMCLPHPQETLAHLSERLTPQGLLRTMVYPHFSRRRVFQIQRVAKLLGLTHEHPAHPQLLQRLIESLSPRHPLNYAFKTYYDSQNPVGVVDAFLHASDRGFTGLDWAALTSQAGLVPGFFLHRPWGQPHEMMQHLGLPDTPLNLALHYLDVWQELRSNFIITFKKANMEKEVASSRLQHPLFDWHNLPGSPLYRARLLKHALLGTKVSSRTHEESVRLTGKDVRSLLGWREGVSDNVKKMLEPRQSILDRASWQMKNTEHEDLFGEPRIGSKVPNPFYGQHFDAWYTHRQLKASGDWPDLKQEHQRWASHASALETETVPWGLTPHHTYSQFADEIDAWLTAKPLSAPVVSWDDLVLPQEQEKRDQVRHWASQFSGLRISGDRGVWRELWVLLFSYEQLFLNLQKS